LTFALEFLPEGVASKLALTAVLGIRTEVAFMQKRVLGIARMMAVAVALTVYPLSASAASITLFSTFGDNNAFGSDGLTVSGAPDPVNNGLKINFGGFVPAGNFVELDLFESMVTALSTTTGDWSEIPGLYPPTVLFSLFADDNGHPGELLYHIYAGWLLTATPQLFFTNSGLAPRLSTDREYWFTASEANGLDGSPDPTLNLVWHNAAGTQTPGLRLIGTVVPEPAPLALLATGVIAALLFRQRKRLTH
jgi:hypothetical protein